MSARIDIESRIYENIFVLKFEKEQNTHALYKCLCMLCNEITYSTYSNLESGSKKSCKRCAQKKTNYKQDCEILKRLKNGDKVSHIARDYNVNRVVIYRIKREDS